MPNYDGSLVRWDNRSVRTPRMSFGRIRYEPGGYCGPRLQRDYQLVVLHAGSCRVEVDGAVRDLAIGEAHLFHPRHRERFAFAVDRESHHSWCSIRPGFVPAAMRSALARAPLQAPLTPLFQQLIAAGFELGGIHDPTDAGVVEQLGLTLFAEYLRMGRRTTERPRREAGLQHALQLLEESFARPACLAEMAAAACCSASTLNRKFRAVTGLTPASYLWRLRTEKGVAMLRETGLAAFEIAARCGFSNPFHFSRSVRRLTGSSPREIRQAAWGRRDPPDRGPAS